MLPLNGRWIFLCQETEFHLKDGVCLCVYRRGGFFPNHVAIGWRALGVIGPPRRRGEDAIQPGDLLLLGKNGELYYTPPIDEISRAKKKRSPKVWRAVAPKRAWAQEAEEASPS